MGFRSHICTPRAVQQVLVTNLRFYIEMYLQLAVFRFESYRDEFPRNNWISSYFEIRENLIWVVLSLKIRYNLLKIIQSEVY